MPRWIRLPAAYLAFCFAVLPAQDEASVLRAFGETTRTKKGERIATDAVLAGLGTLAGLDSAAVARALVGAGLALEAEAAALERERIEASAELSSLTRGQELVAGRDLPGLLRARYRELKALLPKLRARIEALREVQQRLANRIAELRQRDALLCLSAELLSAGKDGAPLPLRLAAAQAIGGGGGVVMPELAAELKRSRDPEVQLALIDAFGIAGAAARPHAAPVVAALQAPDEAVRERAALALARIAVPEAIEPMLRVLRDADGQTRLRVASALEVLTRQSFGTNVGAWQAWWQAEGAAYRSGARELGGGTPSHREATNENYYFGIPQDQSRSIVYVLDCSGSMRKEIEIAPQGATVGGGGGAVRTQSRLDACKAELVRALGKLQPKQRFAILYYNDVPHWWQTKVQAATKDVVQTAQVFVRTLRPAESTNIHDSLEQAFLLVGRGSFDKAYAPEFDTIFLLTDGQPTLPNGKPDSTETILEAVRAWNLLKRVTIHTIGIGPELNDEFLAALARENGGQYKKY